jgi:hypothetical protein
MLSGWWAADSEPALLIRCADVAESELIVLCPEGWFTLWAGGDVGHNDGTRSSPFGRLAAVSNAEPWLTLSSGRQIYVKVLS